MLFNTNRLDPTGRLRRPVRWRRVLPLLALGGLALAAGVQQLGYEFRKYLAFTTADVDGLLPVPPDPRSAITRATVRADHVYSRACGIGVAYCTEPKGEPIKLPRSVTFDFLTELVRGIDKSNKSVALQIPQRWLSPLYVGAATRNPDDRSRGAQGSRRFPRQVTTGRGHHALL